MRTGINLMTLFNGVGGAMMAMDELCIPVDNVYASEIDKYANQGAKLLFPNTTFMGDVTQWRTWPVNFGSVDMLMAGFPCQAWSIAGNQKGDDDPRGALVHVLIDIWSHIKSLNPNVKFMFENVDMKEEFMEYVNNLFGCESVMINAALVTAQNRKRNYWANWEISQPEDKGILLKDILQDGPENTIIMSHKFIKRQQGRKCLVSEIKDKAVNLCALEYVKNGRQGDYILCDEYGNQLLTRPCELRNVEVKKGSLCHHVANTTDINANESNKRVYDVTGKSPTLTTMMGGHREPKVYLGNDLYRKLTPYECMMLQGWTVWVIEILLKSGISNSQLYKMTGNGWAHPVIVHNLRCLLDAGWMREIGVGHFL